MRRTFVVPAPSKREDRLMRLTEAMEGSASPLKPKVLMSTRLSSLSFDVAWRSMESVKSSGAMPEPLSVTRMKDLPPPRKATSICVAPASRAFSTSSFTTLAGRSMTSPAAMRLMVPSESRWIRMDAI
jgi:hypothetical protein